MKIIRALFLAAVTALVLPAPASAQPPSEQLKELTAQLQKSPNDGALREKIVKLAQQVKPPPAIPPDARRAFVMGSAFQKEAKSPEDFAAAVKAFQDATTAAPWWGDAYYNLSVALESAERYDEARNELALYLLTNPRDAEAAQERLYALDAKKAMAASAETRRRTSLEGRWNSFGFVEFDIRKDGNALILVPNGSVGPVGHWLAENVAIGGDRVAFTLVQPNCPQCGRSDYGLSLADGGTRLKGTIRTRSGTEATSFDRK